EVRPVDFARACYARGYAGEDFAERIGTRRISRKERETARLYAEYQRRLARLNLCDADDTAALARELLRAGKCRPFEEVRVVCVDGFTRLSPSHLSVLNALAEHVEGV